ncbi:MAG: hypothetical protein QF600_09285 [Verrucomicrobiota bacterium]|nr:hypothetical protein [Verrucomicrobiota bacterium]
MKRLFWVLLVCPLVIQADEPARMTTFRADATPPLGSALCNGGVKPASEIIQPLSVIGLVLVAPKQDPIVLCAVDWTGIGNDSNKAWRAALANAAGTSPDRVAIHTLHQHDAPGCDFTTVRLLADYGLDELFSNTKHSRKVIASTAEALKKAMSHLQPVTHAGFGKAKVEKFASNRRLLGPDGKVLHVRFSKCRNPEIRALPEGVIDPHVRLVSFWNQDKPLAVLSYYATHPQSYYGQGGVNPDTVGIARQMRAKAVPGAVHIHFAGAGANVAAGKYNDGSPKNRGILAGRLAAGMKTAWKATRKTPLQAKDIQWRVKPVVMPLRDMYQDLSKMETVLKDPRAGTSSRIRAARNIAWARRVKAKNPIDLTCLRLGKESILHMPGELFVEYQLAAQKMRPSDFVAMTAYGDYAPGYIGDAISYTQGGYETGRVSRVGAEVESVLMPALKELLK